MPVMIPIVLTAESDPVILDPDNPPMGHDQGHEPCRLFKLTSPKIYKDQLVGARQILKTHMEHPGCIRVDLLRRLSSTPRLTAAQLRERLAAYPHHPGRWRADSAKPPVLRSANALARYAPLNGLQWPRRKPCRPLTA
ncbi:MAG: hypothetical protein ACRERV_04555 [Methylococcales bacterium]